MTLPHREWTDIEVVTILCQSDDNDCSAIGKWTTDHLVYRDGKAGFLGHYTPQANVYRHWHAVFRPKSADFDLLESLDQCLDYAFWFILTEEGNEAGETSFDLHGYILHEPVAPNAWDFELVNGKYYDGVNNWGFYPPGNGYGYFYIYTVTIANMPYSYRTWTPSFDAGCHSNQWQADFFRNGARVRIGDFAGGQAEPFPPGDDCTAWFEPQKIRVNYLNAVVNSMSRRWIRTGTNPTLILTGLGFSQDDAELNDQSRSPQNTPGSNWESVVDEIDFIGQQGQGTFNITRIGGDFTNNSDTQLTIHNLPNLPEGTYHIRLRKINVGPGACVSDVYSYAGDWRSDESGLCTQGSRMTLLVQESEPREEDLIFLTEWQFKKGDTTISKYFAPIDIRSPDRFYDGRIITHSALTKSVDDDSGLPNISDITVDLANADKEFSKLMAEYTIKNQIVALYSAWKHEPEIWKEYFMQMIVDDWELQGPVLRATLKDITQKYFRITVPRYIITLDEYPNAHESAVGKPMPEIIGRAYLDGELKGAVEAYLVDDATHKYLAARGSLHSVTEVFSENVLQTEGAGNDYTISYEDGGRTYITFNADQGDKKITFNCNGYMLADWNSANGYVQNPAYVIAFFLSLIAEVPINFLSMTSFDTLADLMVDLGWDESAYLILQDFQDMATKLSEMLFTYGAKFFPDNMGRFRVERKDKHSYESDIIIFDQIDTMEPVTYIQNLRELVNRIKAKWQYYPCHSLFLGSAEDIRESSVDTFDVEVEPEQSPFELKWTTSEDVINTRISEELLKKGYGDRKAAFAISMNWVRDLNVLDNFQLQDLFAIDISGDGTSGYYYYIEQLSIDLVGGKIDVLAPDLQWLIRQCMIIGKSSELAEQWADASEWMRVFGYIADCTTGQFSDGEPVKKICKCG